MPPEATPNTAAPAASAPTSTASAMSQPAAPAAAAAAPSAPTTETVNPGSWMAGFNDDLKGYVQNKGFKDPAAVADAYRNLEKLQGVPQDRLMKLPETFYDEKGQLTQEGRGIYERLGAPKDLAGYEIQAPEQGDAARLENFLKTAHDLGLTKAQAQKLAAADDGYLQSTMAKRQEAAAQAFKDQEGALRKDWGAAYEQNKQSAQEGVRRLGWDAAKIDAVASAIGHAEAMKMFAQLGRQVGEAAFVGGKASPRAMEPAQARSKIQELMSDKSFGESLARGDADARATWDRLHQQAYQGTVNI